MIQGDNPAELPLRDIHLPDSSLWWPPAPGWWILLTLILMIIVATVYFIRRRRKHRISALYLARQELTRIENEFKLNQDKSELVKEISELIRRVSISLFKRDESASITGEKWLLFLDQLQGDKSFSNGTGRVLIEAPYQSNPNYDATELLLLTSVWIESAGRNPLPQKLS
ncbi:MAG TPA: DUF4381 domain-containing protein [Thiotrichaceae bacterium]|jgi:hypothetical protein|nr:DUF4381 domain-containing protein [Thiotrichaceae bacterium]HIM07014.1 DUF4381 domain-containing protein [Gammaproteobacteria bacterium]